MIFETYDGRLLLAIHTPNKTPHERAAFFPLRETDEGLELGTACAVCSLSP
jgi:hypothetical protein